MSENKDMLYNDSINRAGGVSMCTRNELNIILQKMAQIYRSVYGEELVQVILYGSYARGDYNHDSDVDL